MKMLNLKLRYASSRVKHPYTKLEKMMIMKQRKFITRNKVNGLLEAAKKGRYGERDYCLLLMVFLHGFRVSELSHLAINDIDLVQKIVYVRRLKSGLSTIQPLSPIEIEAIKAWLDRRQYFSAEKAKWLFISQKHQALSRYQIYLLIKQYGKIAQLGVTVHPHMLGEHKKVWGIPLIN